MSWRRRRGAVSVSGGGRGFRRGADSFCALTRASSTAISRSTAAVAATARARRSFAARTAARRLRSSAAARAASTAASGCRLGPQVLFAQQLRLCALSGAAGRAPGAPPAPGPSVCRRSRQRPSWLCVFCAANCQPTQDAVCHRRRLKRSDPGLWGLHDSTIGP